MSCLDDEQVAALLEGRAPSAERAGIDAHLADCSACRALLAGVVSSAAVAVEAARAPSEPTDEDSFALGATEASPGADASADLRVGDQVGPFVVQGYLGMGGMGIVVRGQDTRLGRSVAIKLIRSDHDRAGGTLQLRLMREAQALALLDHANVVTVYDVGTHGGRVFIAMELVEGQDLGRWLADRPRSWREVLAAYLQAARGLEAAHRAGFVHCDFKPANALMARDGVVRVSDFGLVRLARDPSGQPATPTEPTAATLLATPLTLEGDLRGTPRYMSPEQFTHGLVDARTDQFSFCVSLYEGLYRQRAFVGDDVDTLRDHVVHGHLQPPPEASSVPAWLGRAVARGLSIDPADRYPTMTELIAALERDPARRRRRAALGVGLTLALGAAVAAPWLARRAPDGAVCRGAADRLAGVWDRARRDGVRAAFLASGRPLAAETFDRVASTLDGYADGWTAMRTDACLATAVRREQSPELLDLRLGCLERRRAELRSLTTLLASADAEVVDHAARAARSLGPLETCADASALRRMPTQTPSPAVAALRERLERATASQRAGQLGAALAEGRAVLEAARAAGDAPFLVEALIGLAEVHQLLADARSAESLLREALVAAAKIHDEAATARAWIDLVADVGIQGGRPLEALDLVSFAEAAIASAGEEPRLGARLDLEVGELLNGLGHGAVAEVRLLRARGVLANDVDAPDVATQLGFAYRLQGRFALAAVWLTHARDEAVRIHGPRHPAVAETLILLAEVLRLQGDFDGAERLLREALDMVRAGYGPDHVTVANAERELGILVGQRGQFDAAAARMTSALAIDEKHYGPDHPTVARDLLNLAIADGNRGRLDESERGLQRAAAIYERVAPGHDDLATVYSALAQLRISQHRPADAVDAGQRALDIVERSLGPDHPLITDALVALGGSLIAAGRPIEAIPYLERAVTIRAAAVPDGLATAEARYFLADAEERAAQPAKALEHGEPALALCVAKSPGSPLVPMLQFTIARALVASGGDRARARTLARAARGAYLGGVPHDPQDLAELEAWLRRH
jgi:tetratricopeptide (TPR) repeat protein